MTITSEAPTAPAASTAPSSTRWGSRPSSSRSFALAGSVSEPLTTTGPTRRRPATARSLRAVGKSAPPRPRRPLRSTSSISWWGGMSRQRAVDPGVGGQRHRAPAGLEPGEYARETLVAAVVRAHAPPGEPDSVPVTVLLAVLI